MRLTNRKSGQDSVLQTIVNNLNTHLVRTGPVVSPAVGGQMMALESASDVIRGQLDQGFEDLKMALESIIADSGVDRKSITDAQYEAAAMAGLMSSNWKASLAKNFEPVNVSTEQMQSIMPRGNDSFAKRSFGLEAYDERENKNAMLYTITYNMQSARQDEFGETFFPTITITPDQVGFGVVVDLMTVFDGVEHSTSGVLEEFKRKNIIRAVADPTVLKREQTRIVPVYRTPDTDKFFATGILAAPLILEGESILTAPLKPGVKFDLLGISQTDGLLSKGIMDETDSIDPTISLKNVCLSFTDGSDTDIIQFNTINLPLSNFTYATQSDYREMVLNFKTTSLLINSKTKQRDGTALVALAGVLGVDPNDETDDYVLRVELQVTGSINIETGECSVFGNLVSAFSVQGPTGDLIPLDDGAEGEAFADIMNTGKLIGYDLSAYRTNMNRRQRGQLINTRRYTQLYNVLLRAPITAHHPINTDDSIEASDIQALVTATRIRTSNDAVTALVESALTLNSYVDARDYEGIGPDIMGVGRFYVRPVYYYDSIDMTTSIDSVKSHERAADIQAVLVNKIRDYAFRMYRDSEYQAAADAIAGGVAPVPTVIIGTDPVLARYLEVTGDLRTLTGGFDVKIVTTLDKRVQGKIFVSFGVFNDQRNVAVHPLNFGNLFWAPELVLTANISRSNRISKETVVQPRYQFVTHLPVMTLIEVENVPDVLNKVEIFTSN